MCAYLGSLNLGEQEGISEVNGTSWGSPEVIKAGYIDLHMYIQIGARAPAWTLVNRRVEATSVSGHTPQVLCVCVRLCPVCDYSCRVCVCDLFLFKPEAIKEVYIDSHATHSGVGGGTHRRRATFERC